MNTFEWNNRAVQHLRRGNSSDAVLILLKTVFRLRKARAREGVTNNALLSTTQAAHLTTTLNSTNDKFMANVPINEWPKTRGRRPTENVFQLFDHAFITSSNPADDTAHLRSLTYAMVLYNTGLALHVKGLEEQQPQDDTPQQPAAKDQSLHLAIKFYTMSLRVLEEARQPDEDEPGEVLLLMLALFNNLGFLHSHFFNVREVQRCVEWLRSLVTAKSLMLLPHLRQEHSFFCLSVLIPPGSELALAPAA